MRQAVTAAERGYLVTLGVVPSHAATGYGYIKVGEPMHEAVTTALVERFVEKPDADDAAEVPGRGRLPVERGHLRVAGLRVPPGGGAVPAGARGGPGPGRGAAPDPWLDERCARPAGADPGDQIDAGIAEQAAAEGRVAVVPLEAGWSDIGSWSALLEALSSKSGSSLVASGEHLDRDSKRVLVHGGDRLVVTVGLEDVIIVDTPDALLVCARDRAEEIKPVLDEIARKVGDRYL